MTTPDGGDEIAGEEAGVGWRKYIEDDRFGFPSVVYEFTSTREEDVTITVEESIPATVSETDIGFHSSFGHEYWDLTDDTLVFEYELEGGEAFETVYGIRSGDDGTLQEQLTDPTRLEVDPPLGTPNASESFTRSATNSPYSHGDQAGSAGASDAHTKATETAASGGSDVVDDTDDEPGESVVDELARELEAGTASSESLETLEAHFGDERAASRSVEARVRQMESDLSTLRAYTGALEDFLDDEGSAKEIIEEFESRLASVEDDLDSLEASMEALKDESESVSAGLTEVEGDLESLSATCSVVSDQVDSLSTNVAEIDERVPEYSIDDRFEAVEADQRDLVEFVDSLKAAFNE